MEWGDDAQESIVVVLLEAEDDAEAEIYDKMQRDMQYVDEQYPNLSDLKVNNIAANLRNSDHPLAH